MSSGSKQTGQSQTVVNKDPWGPQQDFLKQGFERAETDLLNNPSQYYPNSTVVPFSNQTENALQRQEDRATMGSPLVQAAQGEAQKTIQGDYLNSNPYLQQAMQAAARPMVENFQDTIMPSIQGGFSGRGRYGSGLQAYQQQKAGSNLMRELGDMGARMSYADYGAERGRQQNALTQAAPLAAQDYLDIAQEAQAGALREGQAGAELQDQINRFNFEQNAPKNALQQYMSIIGGGSFGGTDTTSAPIYQNRAAENVGLLATGAGALSDIASIFPR
jgi:hypothetical protein